MTTNLSPLHIADVQVRQDEDGRYLINDMHSAAVALGANPRSSEPGKFFRSPQTQALIAKLQSEHDRQQTTPNWGSFETTPNPRSLAPVKKYEGRNGGSYVVVELAVAYAAFINVDFHLKVLRTFVAASQPVPAAELRMLKRERDMYKDGVQVLSDMLQEYQRAEFERHPRWVAIADLRKIGYSNGQIARAFGVKLRTIEREITRINQSEFARFLPASPMPAVGSNRLPAVAADPRQMNLEV
jgi:hypothetical protein